MAEPFKYIFKIDGKYTIDTLPMERLADYMADLAKMLGQPERVHFIELRQSSVGLVHVVERESNRAVETRIMELQRGAADLTTMAAYRALDKKLRADDSFASYFPEWASQNDQNVLVLQFPG